MLASCKPIPLSMTSQQLFRTVCLQELLLTWGVDGKVCVWDSYSVGGVTNPLCTLISHSNYPIYALDFVEKASNAKEHADGMIRTVKSHIAIGGGSDGGFLGVPAYLYDV